MKILTERQRTASTASADRPAPVTTASVGAARGASRSLTTGAESLAAVTERLAHLPQGVKPDSAQLPVLPAQFKPFQRALEGWGEQ